ncbi:MAG TPA: hypothetical protein VLC46_21020 [Thermoanaerobaculia bacterium]|nr:hypothetical protein [Thermoanaerobaculia bacterium]
MSAQDRRRAGVPWARLRRFFDDRREVSLREAAALLGRDPAWVIAQLDEVAVPHPEQGIQWGEMAVLVRETLTPAELEALAGGSPGFPALLRVSSVTWRLPAYLLIALEHLVAGERAADPTTASRLTVEAYVARHLELTLDPEVLERLCAEPAFRAAFRFPEEDPADQ